MAFSLTDILRYLHGGDKKKRSAFKSEREAYEFCRRLYKESGGVTPELRRAYEFYVKNSNDGCEPFLGPSKDHDIGDPRSGLHKSL
jgi:hypothetical protein